MPLQWSQQNGYTWTQRSPRTAKPQEFGQTLRARLKSVLGADDSHSNPGTARHPILGRPSGTEWGRWAYRHVDHHARLFGA